jgi:hypothetical protein
MVHSPKLSPFDVSLHPIQAEVISLPSITVIFSDHTTLQQGSKRRAESSFPPRRWEFDCSLGFGDRFYGGKAAAASLIRSIRFQRCVAMTLPLKSLVTFKQRAKFVGVVSSTKIQGFETRRIINRDDTSLLALPLCRSSRGKSVQLCILKPQ